MVAKTNAVPDTDEDIIELTDIIEQGSPPVPEASAPSADDHLHDLLSESAKSEEENDLDALLAEIGSTPQASPKDDPGRTTRDPVSPANQPSVNPNETLDMPDMREVESLLDELNIPAQPPVSADMAAAEQNTGNLDDVIDQLGAASSSAPAATTDPGGELDALLDSVMAGPAVSAPPAELAEDLDALLADASSSAPMATSAAQETKPSIAVSASATLLTPAAKSVAQETSGTAAADPVADLDALLENTAAAKPARPETFQPATPADDLDAFLESIPSASPMEQADETLPPLPESPMEQINEPLPPLPVFPVEHVDEILPSLPKQATANTVDALASAPAPSVPAPAFPGAVRNAVSAIEAPPLPRQWDNLLSPASEQAPAAQPSESADDAVAVSVPRDILERLAHMEKELTELRSAGVAFDSAALEARLKVLEDKSATAASADGANAAASEAFEKRLQVLESRASAEPTAIADNALNAAMGKTEQRVNDLEKDMRDIKSAQAESSAGAALQEMKTLVQGLEERLEHLAARLDMLESGAKENLERAAAAAAARILREELAAILAEGAG